MKERGIIFQGWRVRGILDGRKNQTRRVIRPQPPNIAGAWWEPRGEAFAMYFGIGEDCNTRRIVCPYGQPGDLLWVRETWGAWPSLMGGIQPKTVRYRADGEYDDAAWSWRPSIHMPRCVARLMLLLTDVRVQRVQEISEEDILAEGVDLQPDELYPLINRLDKLRKVFSRVWDSLNAKRGYDWAANPWVWALTFEPVERAEARR